MAKILIIEDEAAIAELEKDYLELSDFEVTLEKDGSSGAARALAEDFDLIILDLMLPGMDGFEICKLIRETKNTPIIMVSAKKEDIDKIRGLGLGADDYMTKPFSPSELVARVKAHLASFQRLTSSNARQNTIIEIRGLKIDKTRAASMSTVRKNHLLRRNSICLHSWQKIQITSLRKKNCSRKSGRWILSAILPQSQYT